MRNTFPDCVQYLITSYDEPYVSQDTNDLCPVISPEETPIKLSKKSKPNYNPETLLSLFSPGKHCQIVAILPFPYPTRFVLTTQSFKINSKLFEYAHITVTLFEKKRGKKIHTKVRVVIM